MCTRAAGACMLNQAGCLAQSLRGPPPYTLAERPMAGNEAREGARVWVARCPCTSVCQTPVFQAISKERPREVQPVPGREAEPTKAQDHGP